jgi:6-phosphogluconolactonase
MMVIRFLSILMIHLELVVFVYGQSAANERYHLLIGVYTSQGKSDGIYVYDFNAKSGSFSYKSKASGIVNPSYLAVSKDRMKVYSVSEMGQGKGSISAFTFNSVSGELGFINNVSSGGDGPCYVEVDDKGDYVFAANYSSGSLSAIPVNEDGSLNSGKQSIQHGGSSINKESQTKPHVHATVLSPDNRYLLASDLGTDKVYIYRFDARNEKPLSPANPPFINVTAGSGPRHLTFHPNGKYVYVINEMEGSISVFKYKEGTLEATQTITLLSTGFKGIIEAADIHISPDGKFLYGSNREESNELVIYSIQNDGKLKYSGRQSTLGKAPRNFAIDPTGTFLLVANQNSDEIVVFKRNKKTGSLQFTGKKISVGMPVCLKFVAIDK